MAPAGSWHHPLSPRLGRGIVLFLAQRRSFHGWSTCPAMHPDLRVLSGIAPYEHDRLSSFFSQTSELSWPPGCSRHQVVACIALFDGKELPFAPQNSSEIWSLCANWSVAARSIPNEMSSAWTARPLSCTMNATFSTLQLADTISKRPQRNISVLSRSHRSPRPSQIQDRTHRLVRGPRTQDVRHFHPQRGRTCPTQTDLDASLLESM